jgi:hypothetical protein
MRPVTDPPKLIFLGAWFDFNFKLIKNRLPNPSKVTIIIDLAISYIYMIFVKINYSYIYKYTHKQILKTCSYQYHKKIFQTANLKKCII